MQTGGAPSRQPGKRHSDEGTRPTVWFDLEGSSLRFLRVSENPEALLDISETLWLEPDFWPGGIHRDDRAVVAAFCTHALLSDRPLGLDCRLMCRDGTAIWVHMMARRSNAEPGVLNGYLMDCRHRVASAAEAMDTPVPEDLLILITERLNQQLRAMSGYAQMLERHLSIQHDDIGSEYALGIRSGLENLHDMLHKTRAATRHRPIDPEVLNHALSLLRNDC